MASSKSPAEVSRLARAFASPDHKRRYVRTLFSTIADRYDLITVVLSFGRDRAWKARLIREARLTPGERVFDLACGTGDLAIAAAAAGASVVGLDLTWRMIELAAAKIAAGGRPAVRLLAGDMGALPFAARTADVITTGYGLRNVPQLDDALGEIARVLRPGGRLLSLDFAHPERPWIRAPYLAYLTAVGAALGWLLHRDPDTYRYIPESLRRYPSPAEITARLRVHGFADVRLIPLLGGLMSLHVARRA